MNFVRRIFISNVPFLLLYKLLLFDTNWIDVDCRTRIQVLPLSTTMRLFISRDDFHFRKIRANFDPTCKTTTEKTKEIAKTKTTTGSLEKVGVKKHGQNKSLFQAIVFTNPTHTVRPLLSSVYNFIIVLELPPAPAARVLFGLVAACCAARRLLRICKLVRGKRC